MSTHLSALTAIADELELLRDYVDRLAPIIASGVAAEPTRHMADAQRIDLLDQTLAALADYARDVAAGRDAAESVRRIGLADVALRLSRGDSSSRNREVACDVELF
ncbi:MAG: hypothetical protein KJS97_00785 [Alphaproteobacteria bacterium]|nr:hypothetical protein [Alphaproteobacteria bacterium]